jgi:hypothetical protein
VAVTLFKDRIGYIVFLRFVKDSEVKEVFQLLLSAAPSENALEVNLFV